MCRVTTTTTKRFLLVVYLQFFLFVCFLPLQTHPRQSESLSTADVFSKIINFLKEVSFTHLIYFMTSSIAEEKWLGKNIGGGYSTASQTLIQKSLSVN